MREDFYVQCRGGVITSLVTRTFSSTKKRQDKTRKAQNCNADVSGPDAARSGPYREKLDRATSQSGRAISRDSGPEKLTSFLVKRAKRVKRAPEVLPRVVLAKKHLKRPIY